MAHVQIRSGDNGPMTLKVIVDGVDLTDHVYTEGFGLVQVGEDPEFRAWGVRMVIAAETLDVDLPDAVVQALRASEPAPRPGGKA